jgi:hypothetical protein
MRRLNLSLLSSSLFASFASFALSFAALSALPIVTGACNNDEPKRPPVYTGGSATPGIGGGGSATDGGLLESGTGADGGVCTDLADTGVDVDQTAVADDLVAGTGGTVTDGTYNLTEARVYVGAAGTPGPTNVVYKESIRITAPNFERVVVFTSSAGSTSEIRSSGTFTQNGTTGVITLSCPSVNTEQVTYTAAANTLTISNVVTKESFVYALTP